MKLGLSLNKEQRLRYSRQFRKVYMGGRRLSGPHLTLIFLPNQLKLSRLGLSVRKKRFKLCVQRNYILRRLREAYRLNRMRFLPGYDIVISAFRFAKGETSFVDIQRELLFLAQKAGLLKNELV